MNAAPQFKHQEDALAVLYDTGQRRYRRLQPTPERPGSAELTGGSGWRISERPLEDISLGGMSLRLRFWEGGRVTVGDLVSIIIDLGGRRHALKGKAVHLSRVRQGWTADWRVGIELCEDRSLQSFWPVLVAYLLSIA